MTEHWFTRLFAGVLYAAMIDEIDRLGCLEASDAQLRVQLLSFARGPVGFGPIEIIINEHMSRDSFLLVSPGRWRL